MSGRYAFSLPEPRQRDGWFRLGSIDVTTTALIVGLGLISMVLYAIDPSIPFHGVFVTELVRTGEVWRLVTWPVAEAPGLWALIGLLWFWFLGHQVEDEIGRKPYTLLVLAMAIIPAALVSLINVVNDTTGGRWSAGSSGVVLVAIGMLTIFGLDNPNARFFFGIPAWVIAGAIVFVEVLSDVGGRRWAQLILVLLVIAVGCFGARQRGMLDHLDFIPVFKRLSSPTPGSYGRARPAKQGPLGRFRRGKGPKPSSSGSGSGSVVAGPWGNQLNGPTPLEQAELDVLLDKISASGIDSLTKQEKDRLNALSKRMRGS